MNLKNLKLNAEQVLGADTAILAEQKPLYEYKEGKKTENQIGMRFDVIAFQNGSLASTSVKVEGISPLDVTDEEIIQANKSLNFYFIRFTGFEGKPYNSNNGMAVSCSAKSVELVSYDEFTLIDV